jgi:hypothetical protein
MKDHVDVFDDAECLRLVWRSIFCASIFLFEFLVTGFAIRFVMLWVPIGMATNEPSFVSLVGRAFLGSTFSVLVFVRICGTA